MSTSDDIAAAIDAVAATLVTDGEQVEGKLTLLKIRFVLGTTCVAIVTDRRLVLQPLGYANRPKGQAISVQRDQIARFAITGFGSDWREAVITSDSMGGFTLRLQTIDGRKLKLGVGYGEQGIAARLTAGPIQTQGVAALLHMLRLVERSAAT